MIAILHGLEVGLSPMQALQRIAVVNGRPTIWGDGALALVQASGLANFVSEVVSGDTPEQWVASCTVLRRGEKQVVTRTFSVEDARRARLWGKAGPWSEYPQRMLQMRARAFALRDVFADVLGGLYLHEELVDCEETSSWQPIAEHGQDPVAGSRSGEDTLQPGSSSHQTAVGPFAARDPARSPASSPVSSIRRTAPPPPWASSTSDASAENGSAVKASSPQSNNSDGSAPEPPSASEPGSPLPPLRTRSMDLRIRRPSATAARRRFNEHWEVRRPRALGDGRPRSIPTRSNPDQVFQDAGAGSPAQNTSAQGGEGPASHAFWQDDLALLDDALCCALDQVTLDEVVADFADRVGRLSGEDSRKAEAIIRRHAARVASLASEADAQGQGHE